MNSKLITRSLTAIDRFRRNRPVKKVQRNHRARNTILPGIDSLDGRVLLAGNVSANILAGVLTINGDAGNNTIQITKLTLPDRLRIQGVSTSVNWVGAQEFPMLNFSSLNINMGAGKDSVTLTNFKIASSITITTGGTGDDKITLDTVTASTLAINSNNLNPKAAPGVQNVKSDIILMNDTITGTTTVNTGFGNDLVAVRSGTYGNVNINTGANANFSVNPLLPLPVDAVDFAPKSAKAVQIASGVGYLPGGDYMIDVHDTSVSSLVICTGDALPDYACDCTVLHDSHINVLNVDISKSASQFQTRSWFALCGGSPTDLLTVASAPPASLFIHAGNNTNVNAFMVNGLAGDMDIQVGDNTWAPQFDKVLYFNVVECSAKAMHFNVGDGNFDIMIAGDNAIGGTGFTLNTKGTTGLGDKNISLFNLTVDGVTDPIYGDSYFLVTVSNDPASNNTVSVDTVIVDVTSLVGNLIDGGGGPLNVFIDVNPGSWSGFDVFGFLNWV